MYAWVSEGVATRGMNRKHTQLHDGLGQQIILEQLADQHEVAALSVARLPLGRFPFLLIDDVRKLLGRRVLHRQRGVAARQQQRAKALLYVCVV